MSARDRHEGPPEAASESWHAYYVLAALCTVLVFSLLDRNILSILLVDIQKELRASDTQMGFLAGMAFAVTNALAGIPLARLADRRSRRNIVALGLAAWSLLTARAATHPVVQQAVADAAHTAGGAVAAAGRRAEPGEAEWGATAGTES